MMTGMIAMMMTAEKTGAESGEYSLYSFRCCLTIEQGLKSSMENTITC